MADHELNKYGDGESKFNKSLEDLRRLSELQNRANTFRLFRDWDNLNNWYECLSAIDDEIFTMLKEEQRQRLLSSRPKNFPININQRIMTIPPYNVREQVREYQRTINSLIIEKGLGFQVKEIRKSFILPTS